MPRYRLTIDYCGSRYCGWQVQPNGESVQGELEKAIKLLTGESVRVTGSGRTDAGVHALSQTVHFDLEKERRPERLFGGLNHFLPDDIRVNAVVEAPPNFHARYDCKEKSYIYLFYRAPERALLKNRAHAVSAQISAEKMRAAAQRFIGEKDFSAFMAGGSDVKTTVRTVTEASVEEKDGLIIFKVSANGFLYNMVRIMAAVLEAAGNGKLSPSDVDRLIAARDRTLIKGTAPAGGLYLLSQRY